MILDLIVLLFLLLILFELNTTTKTTTIVSDVVWLRHLVQCTMIRFIYWHNNGLFGFCLIAAYIQYVRMIEIILFFLSFNPTTTLLSIAISLICFFCWIDNDNNQYFRCCKMTKGNYIPIFKSLFRNWSVLFVNRFR